MIVLDASAAVEILLVGPLAGLVAKRISDESVTLHAPQLLPVEVVHVLRRNTLHGVMSAERGNQALTDLADLGIEYYDHLLLLERIWALRSSLSAYDAAYVALAEALDAPLVTLDGQLGRSHGHHASIEVIAG